MMTRLWSRSSDSEDEVMELSLGATSSSTSSSCCTSDEERDYLSEGDGWHEYEDPSWVRDDNLRYCSLLPSLSLFGFLSFLSFVLVMELVN